MNHEHTRAFLLESGYTIREREDAWSECLIAGHGETWHGRGLDPSEAFSAALNRCFPSQGARAALERLLVERAEDVTAVDEMPSVDAAVAHPPLAHVEEAPPPQPGAPAAIGEPTLAAAGAPVTRPDEPMPASAATTAPRPPERGTEAADEAEPAPQEGWPRGGSLLEAEEEAVSELVSLEAHIESELQELAQAAPQRQRLVLLGWLAQARHNQDVYPTSVEMNAVVSRIVRTLRQRSEAWWPGMIAAFQRDAHPAGSARDLRVPPSALLSWETVAEEAAETLAELEEEEAGLGRDDDGWADRDQLSPPPRDPQGVASQLRAEIEAHGGDIFGRQPKGVPAPGERDLLRWARQVRWLRGSIDGDVWGHLMGRLRFLAYAPTHRTIQELLDPRHKPERAWASLVLSQEADRRAALELEHVLSEVPAPDASEAVFISWLARALPLTTHHKAPIEEAARPLAHRVASVSDTQLPAADRRIRRRLQKLKEALSADTCDPPPCPAANNEITPPPLAPPCVPKLLIEETAGRRVLYVGNRGEDALRGRLRDKFGFSEVTWEEAAPRRLAAAADAIRSGSYDLVLAATGFLRHSYDGQLRKACNAADIPYIRVKKGKAADVQFSLERDLIGVPGRDRDAPPNQRDPAASSLRHTG